MAGLIIDIEQLRRHRCKSAVSIPSLAGAAETLIDVSPSTKLSKAETTGTGATTIRQTALEAAIDRLVLKSPALLDLITTLGLEPVSLTSPPDHDRLWALSGKILQPGQMYTEAEITEQIQQHSKVDADRAKRGFSRMLESNAIESTLQPDCYYLGGATPF